MIFIDASAYLAILQPFDSLHQKGLELGAKIAGKDLVTSFAILGEVLTVGSQRHNRQAAFDFVNDILESNTKIVFEDQNLIDKALTIFSKIKDKDVSWVDCYSFAIIQEQKIPSVFSFDRDFEKYSKAKLLT